MKSFITVLLFASIALNVFAQKKQQYYVVEREKNILLPTSIATKGDSTLQLTFNKRELQTFFDDKVVLEFKKAFPNAKSTFLQRVYKITLPTDSYVSEFYKLKDVELVELTGEGTPIYEPNDYYETPYVANRGLELIHASEAFDITHGNSDIYVGVTDTYFEMTHDELINKIIQNIDVSGSTYFHGTTVAGFVAADTDNGIGVSSIGFNTRLVTSDKMYASGVLELAQIPGVKVINCSWIGSCSNSTVDAEVYREVWEDWGVIVVCGAGNGLNGNHCGSDGHGYVYPASYDHAISVSSVACSFPIGYTHPTYGQIEWNDVHENGVGNPASTHTHNDKVDIVAPGYAVPGGITINNGYTKAWGTSFASPQVAGVCALILSVNPALTPNEVRDILLSTADDIYSIPQNAPYIGLLGSGRVNAYRAVKTAECLSVSNPQLDLYIRNTSKDLASEPDNTAEYMWMSTDIWVRNQADGKYNHEHQNPEYDPQHPNYVYVRVRNTSCATSSGTDELKLYWSKANTSLAWPQHWNGTLFIGDVLMGNQVSTLTIPVLMPGQETILQFEWNVPNPADYTVINSEPWHFCLLARIESAEDLMTFPENNSIYDNVKNNNNIAWKNTTVVDILPNETSNIGAVVAVGNPFNKAHRFKLELIRDTQDQGKELYKEAEIGLKMDDVLFEAWEKGEKSAVNITSTSEENKKIVTDNNVILNNLDFEANQTGTLFLTFNFLSKEQTDKEKFIYHVIQRDAETNEIIGGETFEVRKKQKEGFIADAGDDKIIERNESVLISANFIDAEATYNWYDSDGNLIYSGENFNASPEITTKYKLEIISSTDGFKDYDEIVVKVNPHSITSLSPNPATNQVIVNYKAQDANSAYLIITNVINGTSYNYITLPSETSKTINTTNYISGIYTVTLVCEGVISDSKNLIVE